MVLSVTLDEWSDEDIDHVVECGGNAFANSIYEAYFPAGVSKPGPSASNEERSKFIKSKYESQDFLKQSLRISSTGKSSIQSSFSNKIMNSFRSSFSSSQKSKGAQFIGLIKLKVIQGKNLAVRDMFSSDPYVIAQLGMQKVQTTVAQSNLNPVWNEELMISIPKSYGALRLEVYDYDTFSADDIMGEANVDLQPIINSAMSYGDPSMFGNMQIGKWVKADNNPLVDDSTVNIVDGKIKQDMTLKLQNVESGELQIELEWMPLE
uniref:C2 domain-containing protein n=1 Tax=Daucus carota subsp. sativus TaxID=79200 RepID=A0A166IJI3_DAUCS